MSWIYRQALQNYPFPNILAGDTKAVLVRVGGGNYNPNQDTDNWLSDIPVGAQVAISASLMGRTWALGRFSCADYNFGIVAAGAPCQAIVIFEDSGVPGTSRLLAYIDTGAGLPVTPDGVGTVQVAVAVGGVFTLGG
jgi:hypothetical protein